MGFTPQPLASKGMVMSMMGGRAGRQSHWQLLSTPYLSPLCTKLLKINMVHGYGSVVVHG